MDPAKRFSARADAYAQARPSYPREALDILRTHFGLGPTTVVADLGSGTGIFTRLLLESGALVHAVEPNAEMRREAERTLANFPRFRSFSGRAEETMLPASSMDLVTAAQAFHWFDLARFEVELRRVLRPNGRAVLVWNDRDTEGTPFLGEYETILVEHCPGYRELQGKADTFDKFDQLFGSGGWTRHIAKNDQHLHRDGLIMRVMSASYAPAAGPAHDALATALRAAFDRHAAKGVVRIAYTTVIIGGAPVRGG
jgi:SAM-dependent methyltransferase